MSEGWILRWEGLDPKQEGLREALSTLGNGAFATRGAAEEQHAGEIHYPGTYVAGGYDELSSEVSGRSVINEDLVNFPNWLWLTFRMADGEWLDLWKEEVLEYRQELDLHRGVLARQVRIRDHRGRVTRLEGQRLVHMGRPNLAAIEWRLVAENWSGEIVLRSGIDGSVTNSGVARYRQLASKHLDVTARSAVAPEGICLAVRTRQSRIDVALAARTRVSSGGRCAESERRLLLDDPERIFEDIRIEVREGEPVRVEKIVSLFTSRDRGISEAGVAARLSIQRAPDFSELLAEHAAAWAYLWRRCDIEIEAGGDERGQHDQLVLRLHIFHMLQTVSPNTIHLDAGIPARGLHGEAYRGHVFWDELFVLPFFVQRLPAVARGAILYRYHRLDAARAIARELGCAGAAFPWQSSSDGREATQELHLNPRSGRWDPDHSHLQRHVSSAVAYNVWRYYEATGDREFMEDYGAELILEIARFWSSLTRRNARSGRYEISGVMGPDEYHEKYRGAETGGLSNNAYTNVTVVWCLLRAMDVLEVVSPERKAELFGDLHLDRAELERWDDISRNMTILFHDGVISQFEGYEALEELDWPEYSRRYGRIDRLDRILKAEGDTPDRFKVSKQADVIMLLYLFTRSELRALFARLGYELDDDAIQKNIDYYGARTSHGSTLSKVVFTSAVHRQDCEAGCKLFLSALRSDLFDVQGGTTPEGVHLGAMGGTVDIVTRYYAGLELAAEGVRFAPDLPTRMHRLSLRFQHHRRWYRAELEQRRLRVSVDAAEPDWVTVQVHGRPHLIEPGGEIEVEIEPMPKTRPEPSLRSIDLADGGSA